MKQASGDETGKQVWVLAILSAFSSELKHEHACQTRRGNQSSKDTNILKYTTKMQNIFNYICLQTKNE